MQKQSCLYRDLVSTNIKFVNLNVLNTGLFLNCEEFHVSFVVANYGNIASFIKLKIVGLQI